MYLYWYIITVWSGKKCKKCTSFTSKNKSVIYVMASYQYSLGEKQNSNGVIPKDFFRADKGFQERAN